MATSAISTPTASIQQQSSETTISPRIVAQLKQKARKRSLKIIPSDPSLNPPRMNSPSPDTAESKIRSSSLGSRPPSSNQ